MTILYKLPFLFALATIVLLAASVFFKQADEPYNKDLLMIAVYFALVYWIWMIVSVTTTHKLKRYQKRFWLIILVSVPFFGGIFYQLLHQRNKRIVS